MKIRYNTRKPCTDAELEARNKTALYMDDFTDLATWQIICKRLNVPITADQSSFDAQHVGFG